MYNRKVRPQGVRGERERLRRFQKVPGLSHGLALGVVSSPFKLQRQIFIGDFAIKSRILFPVCAAKPTPAD